MYQEYLNQLQVSIAPLSTDQLKDLLNNDEKLEQKTDEVLEVLKAQKDTLFTENRTKAEQNLAREPKVIELRAQVRDLMEESKTLCSHVQEKMAELKGKSGNVSQDTALALLQTAAAESEDASEAVVQKFKDNEINVDTFLEEFLDQRKIMHLRKLKSEKMQEMLRQAKQQTNNKPAYGNSGFFPTTPGKMAPYPPAGGVPYPLNGPMMPMPPPRPY